MGILFSRLVVSMFLVLLGIVSVEMAHAKEPVNACLAIKGKVYVYFFESAFDNQNGGHFAGGGRITFNNFVERNGSVLGSERYLFNFKRPFEAFPACQPSSDGTATCQMGTQQIRKVTCASTAGQGIIGFTSTGGDAGSWKFSTSNGGKTLWTEASPSHGVWVFQELDRRKGPVRNLKPLEYLQKPPGQ